MHLDCPVGWTTAAMTLGALRGFLFWIFARIRQGLCALRGHDLLLHFESNRLSLRCASCRWESPGWTIACGSRASSQRHARAASKTAPSAMPRHRDRDSVYAHVA